MNELHNMRSAPLRRVITPQGLVEFADIGRGPPILYFHGSGAGADAVAALEQPLVEDGFRLIIPHRPGYFGTPLEDNRSPQDCANLAAGLLESLGIENATVIGMSSGAMAAITFAATHTEITSALILQCALSHPLSASRWMPKQFAWTFPVMKNPHIGQPLFRFAYQFEVSWVRFNPNHLIAHTAGPRKSDIFGDEIMRAMLPRLIAAATSCSKRPAGVENDYRLLFGEPWLQPESIQCPTLVVHDLEDPVARLPHVEWAMECIPHAELCDLHLGGHLIWVGRDSEQMRVRRREFVRDHSHWPCPQASASWDC